MSVHLLSLHHSSRINQILLFSHFQHLGQVLAGFPTGHGEVLQQIVAAILGGGSGDFAFVVGDEAEGLNHQGKNVGGLEVAFNQQVVACEATHGTPIDDFAGPSGVVAQEGGGQVFDGVQGPLSESRFTIGFLHTDVEGGDNFVPYLILTRNEDAAHETQVIDGETGYFFHFLS